MRVKSISVAILASSLSLLSTNGFIIPEASLSRRAGLQIGRQEGFLAATSTEDNEIASSISSDGATQKKKKKLGLITFDLDDTLYPIAPVLDEANAAFSTAMSNFGYVGIAPSDIVKAAKGIRAQVSPAGEGAEAAMDPLKPTTVNHKEIRLAAIRKEMERFILETKLRQTAQDWATDVDDLTAPVRKSAEKWARTTVHSSVVQAVYNAWQMERHHAAERHLYPEAISVIKQIQSEHPDVIIGAVTDGSANPMLMVFSLMPLFDFSVSWEDDMGESAKTEQVKQFTELSDVDRSDDLSWIYRLTLEKGKEMSSLDKQINDEEHADGPEEEWVWIHVGDDLAYDVGGSKTNGAKTVLVELAPEYGQTAKLRLQGERPPWATETMDELENHRKMAMGARDKVDKMITHLGQLPEAVKELLSDD